MFFCLSISGFAQDKFNYIVYKELKEIKGTDYVIASIENWGKLLLKNESLLFINSITGQSKPVNFPKGSTIEKFKQVKIDNLDINLIVASVQNFDSGKSIWNNQKHIFIISIDGQMIKQLTDDSFFSSSWIINKHVGSIVITGQVDSNSNGRSDPSDKSEILIYDLKTLTRIGIN